MGNTKKTKRGLKLVLSGKTVQEAADLVGVPFALLQTKVEQESIASKARYREFQEFRLARFNEEELASWERLLESGVSEEAAMATLCPWPQLITEEEADKRFKTKSKLKFGGTLGMYVLVVRPKELLETATCGWMDDDRVLLLNSFGGEYDIGTIVVDGNVKLEEEVFISDRLRCLVVTGNFSAPTMYVFETEVLVCGDLTLQLLTDHDDLVSVLGNCNIEREARYSD